MLVSGLAFLFSNYMLPYTNLKMGSLLYDVRQQKPALYIREGVFYNGIDGYSIKIGKKDSDNQTLRNVMIYDHTSMRGNSKVVIAESGHMAMSDDEKYLVVTLYNGHSYDEQPGSGSKRNNSHPFMRTDFKSYEFCFDLSTFKLNRTNEDLFKDNFQMLNLKQLSSSLDSFNVQLTDRKGEIANTIRSYYMTYREANLNMTSNSILNFDSLDANNSLPVYENALGQARNVKAYLKSASDELHSRKELMARFSIEWHRKFTLSIACFILFLIGAPLGAIIRKGGIGLPVVVSVAFFLLFHIISIIGEKSAREGVMEVWIGMWIASAVLLPVGLFLLYKATHDSALFDMEAYSRFYNRIFKRQRK
jgi:lipopolysaccharide export system permease protein